MIICSYIDTLEVAFKSSNCVLANMKRASVDLNNDVFLELYNALVRPIMEYTSIFGVHTFVGQKETGKSAASGDQVSIFIK